MVADARMRTRFLAYHAGPWTTRQNGPSGGEPYSIRGDITKLTLETELIGRNMIDRNETP